eukprot:8761970-Alexandrium_andersonii.AAC.1
MAGGGAGDAWSSWRPQMYGQGAIGAPPENEGATGPTDSWQGGSQWRDDDRWWSWRSWWSEQGWGDSDWDGDNRSRPY